MSISIVKQKDAEGLIRKHKPTRVFIKQVSFACGHRPCAFFDVDGITTAVKGTTEHTLRGWLRKVAPHAEVLS